jgi:hypothetical protein
MSSTLVINAMKFWHQAAHDMFNMFHHYYPQASGIHLAEINLL